MNCGRNGMAQDRNILQIIQRQKAHILLDSNKEVQRMWKDYKKKTKGLERLTKPQFYDVYLKNRKVKATSRFAEPHMEVS